MLRVVKQLRLKVLAVDSVDAKLFFDRVKQVLNG